MTEDANKSDEMLRYEQETGKLAVYRGIITESFKKWRNGAKIYKRDKQRIALYISDDEKCRWQRFIEANPSLNISRLIRAAVNFYIDRPGDAGAFQDARQASLGLKNPLTIIKGVSELLLDAYKGRLDADVEARIRDIHSKSLVMEALIKGAIDKPESVGPKYDVLVVDDDPPTVELITGYFEFQRLKVKGMHGPNGVVAEMLDSRPSVLILDVIMPDTDGFALCKQIKNHPVLGNTKVILLTAIPEYHVRKRMDDVGADAYILKPFNLSALDVVKKYV
ncbi:MAG: response regulator [Candidatus Lokiarchaeota archaeon]|nr:response regulator [Candidatus Lokiarchaeota archaeon]